MNVKPLSSLNRYVALALVDMDVLDGLARAEALLQLVALAQRLGLDRHERPTFARADVLHLVRDPELAVVFDDVAGADRVDRDFHGASEGSNEWNSASHAEAGRGRRRACIKGR